MVRMSLQLHWHFSIDAKLICVFPVEPQNPNGKNINLQKKWGFHRFQKERQKVRKSALFA